MNIKKLENKINLFIIKLNIRREFEKLYLHSNFKEYYEIKGQKFIHEDPFGEENWN